MTKSLQALAAMAATLFSSTMAYAAVPGPDSEFELKAVTKDCVRFVTATPRGFSIEMHDGGRIEFTTAPDGRAIGGGMVSKTASDGSSDATVGVKDAVESANSPHAEYPARSGFANSRSPSIGQCDQARMRRIS